VKTRRGHVVLASDASHLYAHVDEGRVFPITYSVAEVLEGYTTLKKLADSPAHIVPGHDPQVLARYPGASAALERWVVRLDVEPAGGVVVSGGVAR
jgi:glyoxylase-like metal-dependent hydrolase (beta-lactamase superfamily II)